MHKVEIQFPGDFDSNKPHSLPLGRLMIGGRMCRLFFNIKGEIEIYAPESVRKAIHFYSYDEDKLYGFGLAPVGTPDAGTAA